MTETHHEDVSQQRLEDRCDGTVSILFLFGFAGTENKRRKKEKENIKNYSKKRKKKRKYIPGVEMIKLKERNYSLAITDVMFSSLPVNIFIT